MSRHILTLSCSIATSRMTPNTYRRQIKDAIVSALRTRNDVAGCWEGGSAATGRLDEFSDIDLVIVASLDAADAIFAAVENAISAVGEISHRWHVDPPPFQDTAQRFYFLAGAPRFFAVDCVIVTATGIAQFLERERHGEPQVEFDRTGQIAALPLDEQTLAARRAHRLGQLRGAVPIYLMLVEKELARDHLLEAFGFYQTLLRALIELLGMRYRPHRFDYGWRYVETELPEHAQHLIERYAFVADHGRLRQLSAELGDELARRLETTTP
jgi:hypothetical protein